MSYKGHVENLLLLIKEKRDSMIAVANQTGFVSEQTIKCSQDLDKLIYEYQEMIYRKKSVYKKPPQEGTVRKVELVKS